MPGGGGGVKKKITESKVGVGVCVEDHTVLSDVPIVSMIIYVYLKVRKYVFDFLNSNRDNHSI